MMRPHETTTREIGRVMAHAPSPMIGCQNSSTPGAVYSDGAADTRLTGYSFVGLWQVSGRAAS